MYQALAQRRVESYRRAQRDKFARDTARQCAVVSSQDVAQRQALQTTVLGPTQPIVRTQSLFNTVSVRPPRCRAAFLCPGAVPGPTPPLATGLLSFALRPCRITIPDLRLHPSIEAARRRFLSGGMCRATCTAADLTALGRKSVRSCPCRFGCASGQSNHTGSSTARLYRGVQPADLGGVTVSSTMRNSQTDRTGSRTTRVCEIMPGPRRILLADVSPVRGRRILRMPLCLPGQLLRRPRRRSQPPRGWTRSRPGRLAVRCPLAAVSPVRSRRILQLFVLSAMAAPAPATSVPSSRPAATGEVSLPPTPHRHHDLLLRPLLTLHFPLPHPLLLPHPLPLPLLPAYHLPRYSRCVRGCRNVLAADGSVEDCL